MRNETKTAGVKKPANVLRNRNFTLLFSGKIISQLGDQIYAFALSWYILDITKSSLQMAVFLLLDTLTVAIVSPFGGIIADRLDRKKILVWMDALRGLVVLAAAVLLYCHALQIWMLYVSAVVLGFCGAVFSPAAGAITPNVVKENQLTQAVSLNNFTNSFCAAAGLVAGGLLYRLAGVFGIFVINALSYLASVVLEALVRLPRARGPARAVRVSIVKRGLLDLKEGFQYLKGNKLLLKLTVFNALFNFLAFPALMVFYPYIFNVILKAEPIQLALTQCSGWVTIFTFSLLAPLFLKRLKFRASILLALSIYSACVAAMAPVMLPPILRLFTNWELTALFIVFGCVLGMAMPFIFVPFKVLFQKHARDKFRGRTFGLMSSLGTATMPLGYFIAGFMAQRAPMAALFIGVAVLMMSVTLWITGTKEVNVLRE